MDPLTLALTLASQFAPGLIKHFTNSDTAGTVAAQVIDLAKTITGQPTAEAAVSALQADPALALQFKLAAMATEADLEKAALADRASARGRDVALVQAGRYNFRADIMVVMDVVGLVGCLVVLAFFRGNMPGELVALLSSIASIFGLCLRDAHQFEFGSSRSSQNKDTTISNLSK